MMACRLLFGRPLTNKHLLPRYTATEASFTQKSYSLIQFLFFFGYEQEAPVGSVVFQAQAIDPDDPTTPNGRLTYKFLDEGTLGSDHAFFEIR